MRGHRQQALEQACDARRVAGSLHLTLYRGGGGGGQVVAGRVTGHGERVFAQSCGP